MFVAAFVIVLAAFTCPSAALADRSCGVVDVGYSLTDCYQGLQRALPYAKTTCNMSDGPAASESVLFSCAIRCAPGQAIAPGGSCSVCSEGYFPQNQKLWLPPYYSLPPDAVSVCVPHTRCPPGLWAPCDDHTCLTSQPGTAFEQRAYDNDLAMTFTIEDYPATIAFEYKVSSELTYDYFAVFLDLEPIVLASGEHSDRWSYFHKSIAAPSSGSLPCHWRIDDDQACIFPNQFYPFRVESFFDAPTYEVRPQTETFTDAEVDLPCGNIQLSSAHHQGSIVVAVLYDFDAGYPGGVPPGHCPPKEIAKAAATAGAKAVLFGIPAGEAVFGEILPSDGPHFPGLVVGSITTSAAEALKSRIAGGGASAAISYTARAASRHRLTFTYSKDEAYTQGQDRAWIRNVVVQGTSGLPRCTPCPAGMSARPGEDLCSHCPPNTFSATDGAPCTLCPTGTISAGGAVKCVPAMECTFADFTPVRSQCYKDGDARWMQDVAYLPVTPPTCNIGATTYTPPANLTVLCPNCPPGNFRDADTGLCIKCPVGTVLEAAADATPISKDARSVCHPCIPGRHADQVLRLPNFNTWQNKFPDFVSRECTGCLGTGWTLTDGEPDPAIVGDDVVSIGASVMPQQTATLTFSLELTAPSAVRLQYTVLQKHDVGIDQASVRVVVLLRDGPEQNATVWHRQLSTASRVGERNIEETPALDRGSYYVQLLYTNEHTLMDTPGRNLFFGLQSIHVDNVAHAGVGSQCEPCPPGYSCKGIDEHGSPALAVPCARGSYTSASGRATCEPCPSGTVSSRVGSTSCVTCPSATAPSLDQGSCDIPQCVFPTYLGMSTQAMTESRWRHARPEDEPASATSVRHAETALGWDAYPDFFNLTHFGRLNHGTEYHVSGLSANRLQSVALHFDLCSASIAQCAPTLQDASSSQHGNAMPGRFFACAKRGDAAPYAVASMSTPTILRDENEEIAGLHIEQSGLPCPHDPSTQSSVAIEMRCDPTWVDEVFVFEARAPTPCAFRFTFSSAYACPVCSNRSYVSTQSDCHGGTMKVRYEHAFRNGSVSSTPRCFGGVPLPAAHDATCAWTSVEFGSSFGVGWAIVIGLVVAFAGLFTTVALLHVRHQRLQKRYSRLSGKPEDDVALDAMGPPVVGYGNGDGTTQQEVEGARGEDMDSPENNEAHEIVEDRKEPIAAASSSTGAAPPPPTPPASPLA